MEATTENLTGLLQKAYSAELETVANYLANSAWLDGLRAQEVKKALGKDVTDELGHATKLAHRLKELHTRVPGSLDLERTQRSLQPPDTPTELASVIKGVLDAENDAIATYQKIIEVADGRDYATQDLAIEILRDEERHRSLFEGFLRSVKPQTDGGES